MLIFWDFLPGKLHMNSSADNIKLTGLMLITKTISDPGLLPASVSCLCFAFTLYRGALSFAFLWNRKLIWYSLGLAYPAWLQSQFCRLFNRDLFWNIFYHPATGQVIFFPGWCFEYILCIRIQAECLNQYKNENKSAHLLIWISWNYKIYYGIPPKIIYCL